MLVVAVGVGQAEANAANVGADSAAPPAVLFERAAALEAEERWQEAAELLGTLVESHPDDYDLFLRLGQLHYRAGHFEQAAGNYRRAAEISGGSLEARLGLAWSLVDSGAEEEAAQLFREILEESPDSELANQGLARAERGWVKTPFEAAGSFSWISHSNHPYRESGWGFAGSVDGIIGDAFPLGMTFRFLRLEQRSADPGQTGSSGPGQGAGGSGGTTSSGGRGSDFDWDQGEIHLRSGVSGLAYDLLGHFSWIKDEGEFDDDLFALGLSIRTRAMRSLWVEASVSFYPDGEVYRVSPAWRIPLFRGFYAQPGAALQVTADNDVEGVGFLELIGEGRRAAFKLGGKFGRESRPTYLSIPIVMNLRDEISWGIWTEGSLRLGRNGRLGLGYALSRLRVQEEQGNEDSEMHVVSVNLAWIF